MTESFATATSAEIVKTGIMVGALAQGATKTQAERMAASLAKTGTTPTAAYVALMATFAKMGPVA